MSFIYDIKKQLVDIGLEFENKFNKVAQQPQPAAAPYTVPNDASATAVKLIDNLLSSMEDVYTKDLKDLRSFVNYLLDKKIEREDARIVYRFDENVGFGSEVSSEFAALSEDVKAQYAQFENAYMVHKMGLTRLLQEKQLQAYQAKNRIAEVMLGKLIDEANRDLKLGMPTSKPGEPPFQPSKPAQDVAGGGDAPDASSTGGEKPGSGTGQSNKQGQMEAGIKSALGGVMPLGRSLDLIIIKQFFVLIQDWTTNPQNQARFEQMLSSEIGAAVGSPILKEKARSIHGIAADGLVRVNDLLSMVQKTVIQINDVQSSSGTNNVQAFQSSVLKPGSNTAQHVVNVANVLGYVVNRVYALEDELIQNDSFLAEQQQIFSGWKDAFNVLQNDAARVSATERTH